MPALDRPNLPMLLLVARERVLARFRPLLHDHGLTEQQWRILRAVHDAGSLEPREIVACCGISGPSLAGVLARMEALGLVERRRFDHDQRRIAVGLSARSERLVARLAPRIEAVYREIEATLGAAVVSGLVEGLTATIASLSVPPEAAEAMPPATDEAAPPARRPKARRGAQAGAGGAAAAPEVDGRSIIAAPGPTRPNRAPAKVAPPAPQRRRN